jgi:hypothetical protein
VVLAILVIIATAVFALPQLPVGTPRIAGWVAVVAVTFIAVWLLKPTARRKRP